MSEEKCEANSTETLHYVLIDFENTQPNSLEILRKGNFRVIVFVGATQKKISIEFVQAMQEFGDDGKYITISGAGTNALDFHIAYYIGELASKHPQAYFHIISHDTGFDPLVEHLQSRNIRVARRQELSAVRSLKLSVGLTNKEKIDAIVKNLKGRKQGRPRRVRTLANTINSLFAEDLSGPQLDSLIAELRRQKVIKEVDGKISYNL
ncbi:NYN domain protein [Thalassoglobus neptunius]|uniref:NYN domain protein n=1 Tax=Thalassoglobus neptunius TaxID=1938619 RepID=A0A5C5VWV1_9PLAN|nr:PIN domain-containing protein [Thalassoglobus neptunius]TWT42597.1 NYN domain protein [Thalassoglobus neptunius]